MDNQLKTFLEQVENLSCNSLTVSQKVLEGGEKEVTLNLSRSPIMPERMESSPRAHICHEAQTFAEMVRVNKTDNTIILMDVENGKVTAILDDKAQKGFEIITLQPSLDPRFASLEKTMLNENLAPKQFAAAALINRDVFSDEDGMKKNLPMLLKQITVANKVTAHEGMGNSATNGLVCETEVKAGKGNEEIALPDSITIETPIYIATEIQKFTIQVTVVPQSATRVMIQTASPEAELCKFKVFQEMLKPLEKLKGVLIGYGQPYYGEWKYNR